MAAVRAYSAEDAARYASTHDTGPSRLNNVAAANRRLSNRSSTISSAAGRAGSMRSVAKLVGVTSS
jgi:hypothetical protein